MDQAGASSRHTSLTGQVKDYERQLSQLEGMTAKYQDLTRQVKEAEDNYQLYQKKQEEARITFELDQNKITNVSLAETPVQSQLPTKPNRPLNLLLGILLGALVSVGSAVAAEFFRENVQTPRELEGLTGMPVLATVPHDRLSRRSPIIDRRRLLTEGEPQMEWAPGD